MKRTFIVLGASIYTQDAGESETKRKSRKKKTNQHNLLAGDKYLTWSMKDDTLTTH